MDASAQISPRSSVDRWSLGAFIAIVTCAFPLLLYLGRNQWFFYDEWWVLGDGTGSQNSFLEAYAGHWITVPMAVYRINFRLFGLNTYLPYQLPVVLLHLGSAVLLRILMRRAGVRGWIATVAALAFVFFGSGEFNVFFGFQVSLTGSLFLGLLLFVLADQPGTINRRDWLGLAVGVVGLMTSAVFVPIVAGFGVAVLMRRGPRVAAFYILPLALIFSVWYAFYGRDDGSLSLSSPDEAIRFVLRMLSGALTSLAQSDLGGLVLGLVAGGAVTVTVIRAIRTRQWAPLAIPAGLLTAWISFATLTALGRANLFGAASANASRYIHISAALLLPLIALGAEYLAQRNVIVGAVPIVVLLIGLPGNYDALAHRNPFTTGSLEHQIASIAHSEHVDDVPPDLEPFTIGPLQQKLPITAAWLSREAEAGRIPRPTGATPQQQLTAYGRLALQQQELPRAVHGCRAAGSNQVRLSLDEGERIAFDGGIQVIVLSDGVRSLPIVFQSSLGPTVAAELGPLELMVFNAAAGHPPELCDLPR
jgi:hypothetical protein